LIRRIFPQIKHIENGGIHPKIARKISHFWVI